MAFEKTVTSDFRSIVKSVFDCRLPGVSVRYPFLFQFPIPQDESITHCVVFNMSEIAIMKYHIVKVSGTLKVSKGAKISKRYNQVLHMTQSTDGKVTNSQLDTRNESQEASPFPAGDHINRRAQRPSKHKIEKNINDPQKKYHLGTVSKYFTGGLKQVSRPNLTLNSDMDEDI